MTTTEDRVIMAWWLHEHDGHAEPPMPAPFFDDAVGHEIEEAP